MKRDDISSGHINAVFVHFHYWKTSLQQLIIKVATLRSLKWTKKTMLQPPPQVEVFIAGSKVGSTPVAPTQAIGTIC